jgi:hypothetical protein
VVERATARAGGAHPAPQDRLPDPVGRLLGEREQDRQLRLVVEVAADDRERVDPEHAAELVLAEAEAVHEKRGGG